MEGQKYTLLQKIRSTIYGELYSASDNKGSLVALKLSRIERGIKRGEDPLGELAILEDLALHDNIGSQYIIRLLDKFTTQLNGVPFYCTVLEYAEGGDLLDKIMDMASVGRQLSFSQIRRYFVMLAKGLSAIHKRGISHLDISLENVLVTGKDELRICDFGQAERKRTIHNPDLRRGKPKYMSPEVYSLEKYDGFKADVWSLGVVLWAMTTGGLIYKKPSLSDHRFAILAKGQEGVTRLLYLDEITDAPPALTHLLSKMLDTNVESRYLIEDVLAHPWLNLTPSPTLKESKVQSPEKYDQKVADLPPCVLPPCVTPPRPLRTFPQISTTPTAKTAVPMSFPPNHNHRLDVTAGIGGLEIGKPFTPAHPVRSYGGAVAGLESGKPFVHSDKDRSSNSNLYRSHTDNASKGDHQNVVSLEDKEIRVRTFSVG